MQLTEHFSLEEFTRSQRAVEIGCDNTHPPVSVVTHLTQLAQRVLEPLRSHFAEPIVISSGYRCRQLNSSVGGVSNSQHLTGQAADIYLGGDTEKEMRYLRYIRSNLDFDQCILEGNERTSWLHVSYNSPTLNRKQSWLQLTKTNGR